MSAIQRLESVGFAICEILAALFIMVFPDEGYILITVILSLSFIISGIKNLWYYFTMARFMVGGMMSLFVGIIVLDFGALTLSLVDVPRFYVLTYLLLVYAFSGGVDILRGLEAKRFETPSWKLDILRGAVNLVIAVCCILFVRKLSVLLFAYGIGLITSAVIRIGRAFTRTSIVFIQ